MIRMRNLFLLWLLVMIVASALYSPASAQGGMSKATAKLLVTDLIEAGFSPTIHLEGGLYFVTVIAEPSQAGTASQVNNFATNRGVTARVLSVRFE